MNRIGIRKEFLLLACAIFVAGCGGTGKPATYPVKGKITGAKESLAGAIIQFSPVEPSKAAFSSGKIAQDGTYQIATLDGRSGAEAGKYKIVLSLGTEAMRAVMAKGPKMVKDTSSPGGGPKMPMGMPNAKGGGKTMVPQFDFPFPSEYASAATSPKEVEVKSGQNTIDISL